MRFTRTPIAALLVLLFAPSHPVLSNPVGEKLIAGSATFQRSANALTIQQTSERAIINWQGFSIGASELTKFIQPSAASAVLNRVVSGNPSSLLGRLEATGKVFLINPNGILVGGGAVINTHAFIGTTLDVSNAKFLAGEDLNFVGDSKAGILNLGAIKAQGGDIFLIGHSVTNAGSLEAAQGTVGLAAGNDVLLRHAGDQRLYVQASVPGSSVTPSGASNSGLIAAVQAELHAGSGNVYALAVNNSGAIHATGITEKNGRVLLTSTGGNIENSGNIVARNANGDGGTITLADVQQASGLSTVTSTGVIDAAGQSGLSTAAKGGTVTLSGYRTVLDGQALVDVSGDAGGGSALVGGDYQGRPGAVDNAQFATVGKDVRINADAVTHGDGGKVIVWADQNTVFNGSISARGGATGGDGGLIETSGKIGLTVGSGARADAGAAAGKAGTWLLDPTNFTVTNGGTTNTGPSFAPSADNNPDNTINGADITTALQNGTDVEIRTASGSNGVGNVTFTSNSFNALIAPGTSKAILRVIADNDITVNAALGGTNANNQFVVDFKAGGNITVSKATQFSGGFVGARNVTMTATKGSIFLGGAVHAVGEIIGGKLTGNDGNMTLNGTQGVTTANLSGSANTLLAKGLLTVDSSAGAADLQGKTEARELTGKVNLNFIQSSGSSGVFSIGTSIGTLKNITSEGGRIDIDNLGSLAIEGAIKAEGAKQNVSIRTTGDMSFLPGGSITTSATGTTSLTITPFSGTSPAGNIASTAVGNITTPVITGGGALVLRPQGSAGISAANPLFTKVSQLEAEPSFGGVFISNTGSALSIGTNAAGRDPDAAALGVRVNVTTTSPISIVNEGSILIQSPTGERVVGPGNVTLRALGASSDILVANVNANGVTSRNGNVTLDAGRDVNIGMFVPVSAAGNIIGATGVDLTAGNQVRIIRGSSVMAQGAGNVNVTASTIDIEDLGPVATRIQTQGGAISLSSRAGGQLFILGSAGGGLFTTVTAGKSGAITLVADRMILEGSMDAGTAEVSIRPQTLGRPISIGPNTLFSPDQGKMVIPDATLDRITAGQVTIGDSLGLAGPSPTTIDEAISRPASGATYSALRFNSNNLTIGTSIDIGSGDLLVRATNVDGSGNINAFSVSAFAQGGAGLNLSGSITAAAAVDAFSTGSLSLSGPITTKGLSVRSSSGAINLGGNITAALSVDASTVGSAGNITFSGPVTTGTLDLRSSSGAINLSGNVTAQTLNASSQGGSINLSGRINAAFLNVNAPAGNIIVENDDNNIGTLRQALFNEEFRLHDGAGGLVVDGLVDGGANSSGRLEVRGGNLVLQQGAKFFFGGNQQTFRLFSDTGFVNLAGADVLVPESGGRWLLYSPSPAVTQLGGLTAPFTFFSLNYPEVPATGGNTLIYASSQPVAPPVPVSGSPATPGADGVSNAVDESKRIFIPAPARLFRLASVDSPQTTFESLSARLANVSRRGGSIFDAPPDEADAFLDLMDKFLTFVDTELPLAVRKIEGQKMDRLETMITGLNNKSLSDGIPELKRIVNELIAGRASMGDVAEAAQKINDAVAGLSAAYNFAVERERAQAHQRAVDAIVTKAASFAGGSAVVADDEGRPIIIPRGNFLPPLPPDPVSGLAQIDSVLMYQQYGYSVGTRVSEQQINAMVAAGGGNLSYREASAIVAAGGGNLTPGVIAALVAAGGGNMSSNQIGSLVAAGGGNMSNPLTMNSIISATMVAAGAGNIIAAGAGNLVAAGAGNMVAAGGLNLVAAGGLNLVAAGGLNLTAQTISNMVAAGGGNFKLSADDAKLILTTGMVAAGAGNLIGNDGGTLVGNDGASLVGNDGASLVGNDGASLIGNDGASLIGNDGGTLVGNDGASLIGNDGGTLLSIAAGMVAAGGGNIKAIDAAGMVAAGAGNFNATVNSLVAAGGGNIASMANMVAAGAGNMVAAGAGNMVAAGAGNLVSGNLLGISAGNGLVNNGGALAVPFSPGGMFQGMGRP